MTQDSTTPVSADRGLSSPETPEALGSPFTPNSHTFTNGSFGLDTSDQKMVGQVLAITSMLSDCAGADTTNLAIYEDMSQLSTYLNTVNSSLTTHAITYPDAAPLTFPKIGFHSKILIGKYVQNLLHGPSKRSIECSEHYQRKDYDSFLHRLDVYPCRNDSGMLSVDAFGRWQSLLPWWVLSKIGPDADEKLSFFQKLSQGGIRHLPQIAHCTCHQDIARLYKHALSVAVKLEHAGLEYSFSDTEMLATALDVETNQICGPALHCVLPSLKVRRGNAGWTTIYPGCGVVQTFDDDGIEFSF